MALFPLVRQGVLGEQYQLESDIFSDARSRSDRAFLSYRAGHLSQFNITDRTVLRRYGYFHCPWYCRRGDICVDFTCHVCSHCQVHFLKADLSMQAYRRYHSPRCFYVHDRRRIRLAG